MLSVIKNDFIFLLNELQVACLLKEDCLKIINSVILNDLERNSRFEFSLQINDGELEKVVRFVNYDNISILENDSFIKRINLIKSLTSNFCENSKFLDKCFKLLKKLHFIRIPIYTGFEFYSCNFCYIKLYLNFFNLCNNLDSKGRDSFIQRVVLNELGLGCRVNNLHLSMIGLTLDKRGFLVNYKLYYLFSNNYIKMDSFFSDQELMIFSWLNKYNRLDYFDIAERYDIKDKLLSRKIEIHPKYSKSILTPLFKISNNLELLSKVENIINRTKGKIEAVGIEKNKLTLYVTMTSYGKICVLS
jgi:hypothetical protein